VFSHSLRYLRDNGNRNLPIKIEWTDIPNYNYGEDEKRNLWDDFFLQPYEVMGYKNLTGEEYAEVEKEHKFMKEDISEGYGTKRGVEISEEKMELGRSLVHQYVRVRPDIQAEVAQFRAKHLAGFKSPFAVHIRLTDKITQSEENFESHVEFRKKIEKFMELNGHDAFFLATDSAKVKAYLKSYFGDKCIVYPSTLSTNKSHYGAVHKDLSIRGFKKAKDIVMETLIMASCDAFISTFSSVSNGVRWLGQNKLANDHHYFLDESDTKSQ